MKPITMIIRKKVRVPTKHQCNHMWRSDWIKVGKISYSDSFDIFYTINNTGLIKNDAQFSKLLYESYGPGIYHINAWRKGHSGIISFFYVKLTHDGFVRMKRNKNQEEKERDDNIKELKKLKKKLIETVGEERIQLTQDIEEIKEDIGFDRELVELTASKNIITGQYLSTTSPIYRMHAYEEYKNIKKIKEVEEAKGVDSFY